MNARALRNMIEGFRENFFIFGDAEYRRSDNNGFARDTANLRNDVARVAANLKRNAKRAEKAEKAG
ncbi:MAG: hypothetical protein LBP86_06645 [Azoarcus sp.]|jgi:hypothetical protein|nr:hypothetical protein [Azoarcus sp.]